MPRAPSANTHSSHQATDHVRILVEGKQGENTAGGNLGSRKASHRRQLTSHPWFGTSVLENCFVLQNKTKTPLERSSMFHMQAPSWLFRKQNFLNLNLYFKREHYDTWRQTAKESDGGGGNRGEQPGGGLGAPRRTPPSDPLPAAQARFHLFTPVTDPWPPCRTAPRADLPLPSIIAEGNLPRNTGYTFSMNLCGLIIIVLSFFSFLNSFV